MSQRSIKTMNKVKNPPNSKWKRVIKFIRSKMTYERYKIDEVELSREFDMNGNLGIY